MRDYIELGPVPADEPCAQVGTPDADLRMRVEVGEYVNQLRRTFPQVAAAGAAFRLKRFSHEFGDYYEAVVAYDDESEAQTAAAFAVEANLPSSWDETARRALGLVTP